MARRLAVAIGSPRRCNQALTAVVLPDGHVTQISVDLPSRDVTATLARLGR